MNEYDDVVLGAGMGGLSVAACLAKQGRRVVVLEQHDLAGGCAHSFDYGKYNFCADVHYLYLCGPGETVDVFLHYIDKEVPFNSLNEDCIDRVITPAVDFRIPLGWEELRSRLHDTFPDEIAAINVYCDQIDLISRQLVELASDVPWYDRKWSDWFKFPKYVHLFSRRNWTLQQLYDLAGLSPKLQDLLAGQSGDYALPPNQIALITHASLVSNYAQGAYYPKHHFRHLVDSVVDTINECGGSVHLSTPVEHIEVRNGRIHSVRSNGESYKARETYISDMDPQLTLGLMHESAAELSEREQQRIKGYEYSISAFNIYLGVNERFDPARYGLGAWNIWYYPHGDLNGSYQRQLEGNLDHPWVFLACPTLKSNAPGMAPPGHHVLEIATVCPYEPFRMLHESDMKAYRKEKRDVYEQVMTSVRDLIPDVDTYIDKKVYGTPTTTEHYLGQPYGNIYGANLVPKQVGLNRLGYHTEVPNLFLVGASAGYPSVPGVINNGMDVAQLITGESIGGANGF